MARRNWNKVSADNISSAMELCLEFAKEKENLSVDRIADRMGLPNKWNIYKWMENGRIPAVELLRFEDACRASFVTKYLATAKDMMLIEMPIGKKVKEVDIMQMHGKFNEAMTLLVNLAAGEASVEETVAALTAFMCDLAYHRENVKKISAPELNFGDEE